MSIERAGKLQKERLNGASCLFLKQKHQVMDRFDPRVENGSLKQQQKNRNSLVDLCNFPIRKTSKNLKTFAWPCCFTLIRSSFLMSFPVYITLILQQNKTSNAYLIRYPPECTHSAITEFGILSKSKSDTSSRNRRQGKFCKWVPSSPVNKHQTREFNNRAETRFMKGM